jgi:hypothetical protein
LAPIEEKFCRTRVTIDDDELSHHASFQRADMVVDTNPVCRDASRGVTCLQRE